MAGPQRSASMVFITFVLLGVVALIVLVLGIVGWKDGDDQGAILFAAGAVSLIITLATYPIASSLDKLARGESSAMQNSADDMLTVLRAISERTSMSDAAKRTQWRHRDLEAIRNAIHQDVKDGKLESAVSLTHILEHVYAAKNEAAQIRQEIGQARADQLDRAVVAAVGEFEKLLNAKEWDRAHAEAKRIEVMYPDSPRAQNLAARTMQAREEYKHDLERKFLEANNRDDVETAMELLKELDKYLTEKEAAPFTEIARGVIGKKRQNLGVQFKLAVHDHEWVNAVAIGEEIIREFPNTKMAEEVRARIDALRQNAATQRAGYGTGQPVV